MVKNKKTSTPKSGPVAVVTRGFNYRALTGKIQVFCRGGYLLDVFALGESTHCVSNDLLSSALYKLSPLFYFRLAITKDNLFW